MKSVSIKDIKQHFAAWAEEASSGEVIQITRHNKPYLRLTGCQPHSLHVGSRAGQADPRPALKGPTDGKWLDVLQEDRREDR